MKDVIKKMKFKANGIVLYAPADLEKEFVQLGFSNAFDKKTKAGNTLVFVNNKKAFVEFLSKQLKHIEPDSVLWFAYAKGSAGIKTDINRDILRLTAEEFGMSTVTAVSINDTWSALRFRPIEKVGK